jgi:hypothetical protein
MTFKEKIEIPGVLCDNIINLINNIYEQKTDLFR